MSTSNNASLATFSDGLADAVDRAAASIVTVYGRRRQSATGIVWDSGTILTASHVIERDDRLAVGLPDGSRVDATLVGRDHGSDLAVLRAETGDVTPIARQTVGARVGQLALAVGRADVSAPQATIGGISTVGGEWRTISGGKVGGFVRAELTMLPGFSGGPLVSVTGEMIGLNTSALGRDGGVTIPVAAIEPILAELTTHGRVRRGYLGVASQAVELSAGVREAQSLAQERGLLIVHVDPAGPADQAGLLIGDVLLAIGDQPVTDTATLQGQLGPDTVDQQRSVRILRGGAVSEREITVGSRS